MRPLRSPFLMKLILANLAIVVLAGCGGPNLPKVKGNITVDGTPADGAILLFHPVEGKEMKLATGVADSDGTYSLVADMKEGIQPGKYAVSLTWPDPAFKPNEASKMRGDAEAGPDLLKGRYVMKEKSGLTAEITSTTSELPPFQLKTK